MGPFFGKGFLGFDIAGNYFVGKMSGVALDSFLDTVAAKSMNTLAARANTMNTYVSFADSCSLDGFPLQAVVDRFFEEAGVEEAPTIFKFCLASVAFCTVVLGLCSADCAMEISRITELAKEAAPREKEAAASTFEDQGCCAFRADSCGYH